MSVAVATFHLDKSWLRQPAPPWFAGHLYAGECAEMSLVRDCSDCRRPGIAAVGTKNTRVRGVDVHIRVVDVRNSSTYSCRYLFE